MGEGVGPRPARGPFRGFQESSAFLMAARRHATSPVRRAVSSCRADLRADPRAWRCWGGGVRVGTCWPWEPNFGVDVEPEPRTLVVPGAHQALPLSLSLSLLGRALAERCVCLQTGRQRRRAHHAEGQAGPRGPHEEDLGGTGRFAEPRGPHGAAGCVPRRAGRGAGRRGRGGTASECARRPQVPWGPASTLAAHPSSARPTGCGSRPCWRSDACGAS